MHRRRGGRRYSRRDRQRVQRCRPRGKTQQHHNPDGSSRWFGDDRISSGARCGRAQTGAMAGHWRGDRGPRRGRSDCRCHRCLNTETQGTNLYLRGSFERSGAPEGTVRVPPPSLWRVRCEAVRAACCSSSDDRGGAGLSIPSQKKLGEADAHRRLGRPAEVLPKRRIVRYPVRPEAI